MTNYSPTARIGHSMVYYKEQLILFGGMEEIAHEKNDLLLFDFKVNEWKIIELVSIFRKNEDLIKKSLVKSKANQPRVSTLSIDNIKPSNKEMLSL